MNKTQKFVGIVATVVALGIASQANALTENWSAINGMYLTLGDEATGVIQGCLIKVGTVTNLTAIINAAYVNNDPSTVEALFTVFATGLVGDGTGMDGMFTEASIATADATILGKQVYVLAFDADTAAGAGAVGLFAITNNVNWLFPSADEGVGTIDLADGGLVALIGSIGIGTVVDPTDLAGANAAALYTIPEPSTLMLVGLGLLGAVGLRRRHRS